MRTVQRLDRLQRRRPVLGVPVAVVYKYLDDHGAHLAVLLTYYGLVSLFPLLLLGSTLLGLVLAGHPELQARVLGSALEQLPVIGGDLDRPEQLGGGIGGVVVGLLGAAYGGAGVARALQNASDTAWAVPRAQRPNPVVGRVRGLALVAAIALDLLITAGLAALLPGALLLPGAWAVHAVAFAVVFRLSATRQVSWRQALAGAALAGALWLGLQSAGLSLVQGRLGTSSVSNEVFALVLGLLAFLYLQSVMVVLCLELNVVLDQRLYPRSLLSPFLASTPLTRADRRSYARTAQAQQLQESEIIRVEFRPEAPAPDRAD